MKLKSRIAFAAAAAAALVAVPGTAHAVDFSLYSTSGKSYLYYDDPNNRVITCDLKPNDGIGAYGLYWSQRIVYNDCQVAGNVPDDGGMMYAQICDYVSRNGERVKENCNILHMPR